MSESSWTKATGKHAEANIESLPRAFRAEADHRPQNGRFEPNSRVLLGRSCRYSARPGFTMSMQRIVYCGLLLCIALAGPVQAEILLPPVPENYPSHVSVDGCSKRSLRAKLQAYNHTRLDVAKVLRGFADKQPMSADARLKLIGFADNLDEMRARLPDPDPDSTAFQNFDFRMGLAFSSINLFLNTEDERLTQRFFADRDDPNSQLGRYLARLDLIRQQYFDGLEAARDADCRT